MKNNSQTCRDLVTYTIYILVFISPQKLFFLSLIGLFIPAAKEEHFVVKNDQYTDLLR